MSSAPNWNGEHIVCIRVYDLQDSGYFETSIALPNPRYWNVRGAEGDRGIWVRTSLPSCDELNRKIRTILSTIHTVHRSYPSVSVPQIIAFVEQLTFDEMKDVDSHYKLPLSHVEELAFLRQGALATSIVELKKKLKRLKRQLE
ncbi:hypothetical protein GCM10027594_01420 [Hymenobacter agri]